MYTHLLFLIISSLDLLLFYYYLLNVIRYIHAVFNIHESFIFAYIFQLKEILKLSKNNNFKNQVFIFQYVSAVNKFFKDLVSIEKDLAYFNGVFVSPLMTNMFLANIIVNIYSISVLFYRNLELLEYSIIAFFTCVQIFVYSMFVVPLLYVTLLFYKTFISCAESKVLTFNSQLGFLTKIKLATNFESAYLKRRFYFTLGSIGNFSQYSIYMVSWLFNNVFLY